MIDERVLAQAIEQTERRHAEPTVTADGAVWLTIVCATWAVMVDYLAGAGLISGRDRAAALSEGHAHGGPLRVTYVGRLDSTQFRAQARAAAADCECDGITAFDAFGRPIRVGACPTCDAPFRLLTADEQALAEMRQGATAYIRAGGREELLTTMQRQGWTWAEDLLATSTLHVDMIDEDDLACARAEVNTRALARTDAENALQLQQAFGGALETANPQLAQRLAQQLAREDAEKSVTEARASAAEELAGLVLHEVGEQLSRVYRGWRIDHDTGLKGPKTREGQGVERIVDEHLTMQIELEHARGERGSRGSIGVHIEGEEIIVRNTSFGLRVDPVSIEKTRDAIRAKREAATAKLRGAHAGKSEALERALVGLGKVDAVLLGRPVDGRVYEGEIGDLLARLSNALAGTTIRTAAGASSPQAAQATSTKGE